MLERERPLGTGAGELREPLGQGGRAVRVDEDGDTVELVVSTSGYQSRTAASRFARGGVDGSSSGTSSSRRCTASPISVAARPPSPPLAPHGLTAWEAENALGVEAVRAALEERERAVREAPNVVDGRLRNLGEAGQLDPEARAPGRELVEEPKL